MFNFLKKKKVEEAKPKPEPRKFYFQGEVAIMDIAVMCDSTTNSENKRTAKYILWREIGEIFPETKEGIWEVVWETATEVCVVEQS